MKRPALLALVLATAALPLGAAPALARQAPATAGALTIPPGLVTFNGTVPNPLALHPWELAVLP